ncbi:hypothetical protein EYR41_004281 [Orbilia oligospora]|uniref:Uncharacterized protein n=1 Tax=Orbilia oligospora TaxID=2813651 RepID=A0A8H2E4N7_ORBOL|nr:hypothetical protein EYR41_004281 [Orbilia oligospora]
MTAIFVRDFGLAKISFTIPGTLKLQKAWAEFTGGDFVSGKDIDDLLDAINREFYKGAADHIEDQLYQTCMWEKFNPSSPEFIPWRNKPAWSRYQQYKVYMMWEALYYQSEVFQLLIDNEDMDLEFLEQENSIKFTVHSGYY